MDATNLDHAFSRISEFWSPRIIARINDLDVKLAAIDGPFTWHRHADTDELFLVHSGRLTIHLRDRAVQLEAGDLFVVPKGVEHKPVADGPCRILIIESAGTVNTGDGPSDEPSDRRSTAGEWL